MDETAETEKTSVLGTRNHVIVLNELFLFTGVI